MIYFEGTDNTLWQLNPDGTGGAKVAGFKCKSRPIAYGSFLYFQGTDDKLWQCNLDGSNSSVFGGNKTSSSPFVCATGVYFRGTDDQLWKINLDGTGQMNVGGNTTHATPSVIGQYVFFQGTDNKLWRINIDGTGGINIGLFQTKSSPFATTRYVFFQSTDDKLWRCNLDGTGGINLGGYKCSSPPFATDTNVYFQGTDNKLWKINLDGSSGVNLGGYKCASSPTVDTSQNFVYFQGTDNALWRINLDGSNGTHLGGFNTATTPFVVQPANQPQSGSLKLPYAPLLLVYSPPGGSTGTDGQVEYTTGSTAGTTVSISNSFNWTLGIAASRDKVATGGFGVAESTTDTSTLDIKKTETYDLKVSGSKSDGINHDDDLIYILLSPVINVVIDPNYNMNWGLDFESGSGGVVALKMSWLKDQTLLASANPDVLKRCTNAGMTAGDFAQLLTLNPFASGPAAIDPNRYLLTNIYLPYEADLPATQNTAINNTVTYTAAHSDQTTLSINPLEVDIPILKSVLKVTGSLSWSTTTTKTNTNIATQTASVSFGVPAEGTPQSDVLVYWDTMFNVFMFAFATTSPSVTGTFTDSSTKKPLPHTKVMLTVGTKVYYAITNAKGVYNFYQTGQGTVTLAPREIHIGDPVRVLASA